MINRGRLNALAIVLRVPRSAWCAALAVVVCAACGSSQPKPAADTDAGRGGIDRDAGAEAARDSGTERGSNGGPARDAAADAGTDAGIDAAPGDAGIGRDAGATSNDAGIICGDGNVAPSEKCDDGNNDAHDGCSPKCSVERGFSCGGSPKSSCVSLTGAPEGTISFFATDACPSFWERATAVDGRLVVASATEVGLQVGTQLADMENRTHHHAVTANIAPPTRSISAASGSNLSAAQSATVEATFATADAESGLPMQQLLACRAGVRAPRGDGFPVGAVAAFDTTSCPAGWSAYPDAIGRTLVAASSGTTSVGVALSSGEQRTHSHDWSGDVAASSSVSFVGAAGAGISLADSAAFALAGATDPAWDGIPYIQLRYCQKDEKPNEATLPTGTLTFFPTGGCPAGWSEAANDGKYLVGTPPGGGVGAKFGSSGHAHDIQTQVTFAAEGIALASGCCGSGYRAAGMADLAGSTSRADSTFPRLELPLCVK